MQGPQQVLAGPQAADIACHLQQQHTVEDLLWSDDLVEIPVIVHENAV
jgi:hypothetical protein